MLRRFAIIVLGLCLLRGVIPAAAQETPEERADALLADMTLDEKIAQMMLVEINSINPLDMMELGIGGVLSGGGGVPPGVNNVENWANMVDSLQELAMQSRLGIPMIYGVDSVHGHNNLYGAVIFPHNIGLGATRDPELVEQICRATALETIATGIYWTYAPVVAVGQDPRWGRYYESYGESTDLVSEMGTACVNGLQNGNLADPLSMLATVKHFVGDGGAVWGSSTTGDYEIDQGVTDVDEATLRSIHLPPYIAAIEAGAQSIMTSFSSWGGMKMHAQQYLITEVLKTELGFDGFVVTDWAGIDQISPNFYDSVVAGINAGNDLVMVPYDYHRFMETLKEAVEAGDVPIERIDDAVRRILVVKGRMGLWDHPFSNPDLAEAVGSDEHRALARQAVAESQVLLKNEGDLLPLSPDIDRIFVAGAAHNIGVQTGGWTITWQGAAGSITEGTTILDGIRATVSADTEVVYTSNGDFDDDHAEVGILVIAEQPYAEGVGDSDSLEIPRTSEIALENMREHVDQLIVIIVSGRPLVITNEIDQFDALVAAWLPGTEGQGVADVLFGVQPFTGTLPVTWMASVDQLPLSNLLASGAEPLFPFGFGLTTE